MHVYFFWFKMLLCVTLYDTFHMFSVQSILLIVITSQHPIIAKLRVMKIWLHYGQKYINQRVLRELQRVKSRSEEVFFFTSALTFTLAQNVNTFSTPAGDSLGASCFMSLWSCT